MSYRTFALAAALLLSACATTASPKAPDAFLANLKSLCGKSFAGKVVTTDPADAAFAGKPLVMRVEGCAESQVRIPFAVGEDRSRTWVITRVGDGVRLKHDHRHADGTEDELSQYGGDTLDPGAAGRQAFPADAFSRSLFLGKGNPASVDNVWAVEIRPGQTFAYELRRPNRHFRVEFDLTRPL
ncbi:hypothetical protein [Caulobacter mirabilis]|uniref:Secreted protein n=1 Tax=Caulobacter mirabilis TaxID=69666 RepID=A0A2D2AXJ6_9CAUL|nr:hypothetical protein [Caulobacter mirabilis]ATQ42657.1 hypothetical protein CSW64_09665 [Caulobacter mirabilis]